MWVERKTTLIVNDFSLTSFNLYKKMCQNTATKFDNEICIREFLSLGTRRSKLDKLGTVLKATQF